MGFALAAIGWALAQACIYLFGSIMVTTWYVIMGLVAGIMAAIILTVASVTRNPTGHRSLIWVPAGWAVALILWQSGFHGEPMRSAVLATLIGLASSLIFVTIDRRLPKTCSLCGQKAILSRDLEVRDRAHHAYVFIDYGSPICSHCEAKLLKNTLQETQRYVEYRLADIAPSEPSTPPGERPSG